MLFSRLAIRIYFVVLAFLISNPLVKFHKFVECTSLVHDHKALLSFKSTLDPSNTLSSWDQNHVNTCNWTGVICNYKDQNPINSNNKQRVVGLNLHNFGLSGTISPDIGNLSFLHYLRLSNNKLHGTLPDRIGDLSRLRTLNLSSNNLQGEIPLNISRCSELNVLDLMGNEFSGPIPPTYGQNLQVLKLSQNQLSGTIPASIGNLTSLTNLDLSTNSISGPIPPDLGRLRNLKELRLSINNLTGTVPLSLYNISSLMYFALPANHLHGEIPSDVGEKLPNLLEFNFCINKFTGGIPGSLHYLPNIQVIRMAHNLLKGQIPPGLENLRSLRMYNIGYNNIAGSLSFITSFSNSPKLAFLGLDGNRFEGAIPEQVGYKLSNTSLTNLYLGENRLSGKIPSSLAHLTNLALLNLSHNSISGEIPSEIGQLESLQELNLAENKISGEIPSSLGKLTKLTNLELSGNELVGEIPDTFRNLQRLLSVDLSRNRLHGSVPEQVFLGLSNSLTSVLNLSRNSLDGPLSPEVGKLKNLVTIDLSHNSLSGNIPDSIDNCKSLEKLFLADNSFNGQIPVTLGLVKGLEILDLSSNQLSGLIPDELEKLQALQFLNVSYNNLEGQVPRNGIFKNMSNVDVRGNSKLCLYFSRSLTCLGRTKKPFITRVIIPVIIASMTLCFLVILVVWFVLTYVKRASRLQSKDKKKGVVDVDMELFKGENRHQNQMVSFEELRAGTNNFDKANLIGSGSFGSVYKAKLWGEIGVAVKVLKLDQPGASKSFFAECNALRNVRHRNLVKLITSCSSVEFRNNKHHEFRALVYEFLSNGSLEDWIRGRRTKNMGDVEEEGIGHEIVKMNTMDRLNVVIDVATALEYLHHDCEDPVVHCDLKPSNVILDENMTAKVGDFGLARTLYLSACGDQHSSTYGLKGSIGYIPPEYGLGVKPATSGDVYSYGVLLLELFTGKSPTHEDFNGGTSLTKWVKSAYPHNIMQVIDPYLQHVSSPSASDSVTDENNRFQIIEEECWISIMEIGLSCSADYPETRITIREALHKLKAIRDFLCKSMSTISIN